MRRPPKFGLVALNTYRICGVDYQIYHHKSEVQSMIDADSTGFS